eukprot:GDKJ01014445.1.p1 GENE.GDKJ01014445.1~~GDKJ01014445.1.p1  ORF type:complete len:419 (-),score=109.11 GDKJ01014445.1:50-1285(-)
MYYREDFNKNSHHLTRNCASDSDGSYYRFHEQDFMPRSLRENNNVGVYVTHSPLRTQVDVNTSNTSLPRENFESNVNLNSDFTRQGRMSFISNVKQHQTPQINPSFPASSTIHKPQAAQDKPSMTSHNYLNMMSSNPLSTSAQLNNTPLAQMNEGPTSSSSYNKSQFEPLSFSSNRPFSSSSHTTSVNPAASNATGTLAAAVNIGLNRVNSRSALGSHLPSSMRPASSSSLMMNVTVDHNNNSQSNHFIPTVKLTSHNNHTEIQNSESQDFRSSNNMGKSSLPVFYPSASSKCVENPPYNVQQSSCLSNDNLISSTSLILTNDSPRRMSNNQSENLKSSSTTSTTVVVSSPSRGNNKFNNHSKVTVTSMSANKSSSTSAVEDLALAADAQAESLLSRLRALQSQLGKANGS